MMNHKKSIDCCGLTLIEMMIAISLVAVGLILLLGAFPSIHGTIGTNRDVTRAVSHGLTVLEELRALPTSEVEAYVPPALDELGADELITVTVLDNNGNEVALPVDFGTVAGGVPDPVEVRVRVQWTDESGRPKTTTFSTKKLMLT